MVNTSSTHAGLPQSPKARSPQREPFSPGPQVKVQSNATPENEKQLLMEEYLRTRLAEIVHRGRELPVKDIIFSPPPEGRARMRDPYAHLHRKRASRHDKA